MAWSSGTGTLLTRKLRDKLAEAREELAGYITGLRTDLTSLENTVQNIRDAGLAVRAEVIAARDSHPTVDARLDAVEARLTALETPPTP